MCWILMLQQSTLLSVFCSFSFWISSSRSEYHYRLMNRCASSPAGLDRPHASGCCVCRRFWLWESFSAAVWLQSAACPWRDSSTDNRETRSPRSGLPNRGRNLLVMTWNIHTPPAKCAEAEWKPTWDFMNNVKRREVTEGGSSKNAVAVVQRTDVHHAQI